MTDRIYNDIEIIGYFLYLFLNLKIHQVSCLYRPSFSIFDKYNSASVIVMSPCVSNTQVSACRTACGILPDDLLTVRTISEIKGTKTYPHTNTSPPCSASTSKTTLACSLTKSCT